MKKRGISPADLSHLARKDQGVISRILNGQRKPSPETIRAIAIALKLPPETVFRAAGLLPDIQIGDDLVEQADYIIKNFKHDATRKKALEYLEFLSSQEENAKYNVAISSKNTPKPKTI